MKADMTEYPTHYSESDRRACDLLLRALEMDLDYAMSLYARNYPEYGPFEVLTLLTLTKMDEMTSE